ncbi:dihydrodipicolinate synthase family protein, partial [Rhizobium ruizarguesonis]
GTGELFSLTQGEVVEVVKAARAVSGDATVIAGCGYGTRIACDMAREIEPAGGDGILLLPHYLTEAPGDGIAARVRAV